MRSIAFRLNRRGAVLPLTIIVLAMMAVAVAISYARISSERVTTSDVKAQQGAGRAKAVNVPFPGPPAK